MSLKNKEVSVIRFKKLISVLSVILLAFSVMSGCSGKTAAETKETETSAAEPLPDYAVAYIKVLRDFMNSDLNQYGDASFILANIDDDDIPELLISDTCAKFGVVYVYTYNVNEAVLIETTGSNGVIYYVPGSGRFVCLDEDMFCSTVTVFNMNATLTEQVWTGRAERESEKDAASGDEINYYSGTEEIDESTYNALLSEYMPEGISSNSEGYPLTEDNINTYVK